MLVVVTIVLLRPERAGPPRPAWRRSSPRGSTDFRASSSAACRGRSRRAAASAVAGGGVACASPCQKCGRTEGTQSAVCLGSRAVMADVEVLAVIANQTWVHVQQHAVASVRAIRGVPRFVFGPVELLLEARFIRALVGVH